MKHETDEEIKDRDIEEALGENENEIELEQAQEVDEEISEDGEQKINFKKAMSVVGVFVCGIIILVFGTMRIKNIIVAPFEEYGNLHTNNANEDANYANMQMDEMTALQGKDTDGDGLNDYDEIYVYKTSAFIEDTDSDGFSDFDELQSGEDPLCPRGQDCYAEELYTNDANEDANYANMQMDDIDVAELRQSLLGAGMDATIVNQIDDATLLEMYKETVSDQEIEKLRNKEIEGTNVTNMEDLENLSVEQIRALLVEAGADSEMLGQIDDEMLRAIYLETLSEME